MKKLYILFIYLIITFATVSGQDRPFDTQLIKFNVLTTAIKSYNLSYEATLNSNWSLGLSANLRPQNSFPFRNKIDRYYSDQDLTLSGTEISQFSITPELRYYPYFSSNLRGFYVAYFLQYARYGIASHMDYIGMGSASSPSKFKFDGAIHTYTLGASIGYQWRLSDSFYCDWQIVGPNFGLNKGQVKGVNTNNKPLNAYQQDNIRNKPDEFDMPIVKVNIETNGEQIDVKTKGMMVGARVGLSIGYKF